MSPVQRYFSTFPGSLPGIGLLLLRIAVGGVAAIEGLVYLRHLGASGELMSIAAGLAAASGLAVLAGFMTPASGIVAGASTVVIVVSVAPETSMFVNRPAALILAIDAAALVLLGPGALSMDARLFGRREIILPHGSPR